MKIAIIGGGICGLAAAINLKQTGYDVEVYERHAQHSDIGAGIVLWPNATFVLKELGLLNELTNSSGSIQFMRRYAADGEPLGVLDVDKLSGLMAHPSLAILRKDLLSILAKRVFDVGVPVNFQHKITSIEDVKANRTKVRFENGLQIEPDLVLGCDGRMNSICRKYVNGDNFPVYHGFINWIGVFESEKEIFTELSVQDYWGVGERFGLVPVSTKKAYWAGGAAAKSIQGKEPNNYKSELLNIFETWPATIPNIIKQTPLKSINKIYVHDHNPIPKWFKNNVLLLGDAAHAPLPTSGQGACQAIEDVWHLGHCLKQNGSQLTNAFEQYSAVRMEKTTKITFQGRQLAASIFNTNAPYCQQRNEASQNTNFNQAVIGMAKSWSSGLPI